MTVRPPTRWPNCGPARKALLSLAVFLSGMLSAGSSEAEFVWGVNGHPFSAYPGVTFEEQIDLTRGFGGQSYRVDVTSLDHLDPLKTLVEVARVRGVTILPILIPPVDLEADAPEALYDKSFAFAERFVGAFPEIAVWELGNELENFAIIQPCEMRDDGTQYPCEWGPAGGVGADEYHGPRYRKVAAVLRGLSDGTAKANPNAKRAIGSAGWGHVGIFERLARDGVAWDISVWHMYEFKDNWAFEILAKYGKPIWVTEFNHGLGSRKDGEEGQAAGLKSMMERLRALEKPYGVEAAFIYELLDETYWEPSFEAYMGLVRLSKAPDDQWMVGLPKPAYRVAEEVIRTAPQSE